MAEKVYGLNTVLVLAVVFIIVGAGIGYGASWAVGPGAVSPTDLGTLKAGFIYVGPIGDFGWSHAHDQGRLFVDDKYDWLETVYLESVPEDQTANRIDYLINEQGCDVVFTTSFGFMDGTIDAAGNHPDKILFHCSGYLRAANVGTYFADFYQLYYLNGIRVGRPGSELLGHMRSQVASDRLVRPSCSKNCCRIPHSRGLRYVGVY